MITTNFIMLVGHADKTVHRFFLSNKVEKAKKEFAHRCSHNPEIVWGHLIYTYNGNIVDSYMTIRLEETKG